MKKIIFISFIIVLTFIITTFIVSKNIINGSDFYKDFSIISVNNINTKFEIKYEKLRNALNYEILVYNDNNEIIYNEKTTNNKLTFN